jgi:signal transduction histidine kinase
MFQMLLRSIFQTNRVFAFLIFFRWASLLPVLFTLNAGSQSRYALPSILVFGITLLANLFITLTIAVSIKWWLIILRSSALIWSFLQASWRSLAGFTVPTTSMRSVHYWQAHFSFKCAAVQQRVLGAVTTGLGFRRAVVGVVDPARNEMGGWMLYPVNSSFPAIDPLPLKSENGKIFKALLERTTYKTGADGETLISHTALNTWLKTCQWYVYPLSLREHMVGILMVELDKGKELTRQREDVITMVANQAALALGTTILCIDRARRLAVETERNRIARDIHDTVAQSLFGITYSLDACINMLPAKAEDVKKELIDLKTLASSAHDEVRRSIFDLWPSALTMDSFMADLDNYISSCCRPRSFSIVFNHHGDFDSLPSGLRRTIYRMTQEALANSARHSGANSARVCLTIAEHEVVLDVSDQGRGFDPTVALSRSRNREHFGLHGIQERARALGGDCEIISQPDAGTRIMINLPIDGHHLHA